MWGLFVPVRAAVPQCSEVIVPPAHEGPVGKDATRLPVAGLNLVVIEGEGSG